MAKRNRGKLRGSSEDEDGLCEYEKKRKANIKINEEMMKALGLPTEEKGRKVGKTKKDNERPAKRRGSRRSTRVNSKRKRSQWVESGSDSDSEWEPWMELQSKSTRTKLPDLTWEERLEMLEEVDRQVEERLDQVLYRDSRKVKKGRGHCRSETDTISHLPQSNLIDIFLESEDEFEFRGFTMAEMEQDEMYRSYLEKECVEDASGPTDIHGRLLFPDLSDDEEFLGFTLEEVMLTEVPGYRTRRMTGLQTATTYEEDELSDEDEYLFCDDCDILYHGDCPVHGPLTELDSTSGHDRASLVYTPLPVPAQLTIKPSSIPGAGLGVFSTTTVSKRVRVGPYEGKKIRREDMGDVFNTAYAWEVRPDGEESYFIDGSDPSCSNWMRFVNCARHEEEQNLLAYQYHGNIYYRTFKTIHPHTELLVWYGEKFARELGIISRTKGSEPINKSDAKNRILDRKNVELKHQKNYCEYKSRDKNDVSRQIKTQTADKPYQCDYCEYRCSQKNSLQQHIRTHTGDKPYQCDYCEYRCSLKQNLQRHIRTHTGDKPYQCDYCEYRCSQKSNLQQHITRIHIVLQ